jgi:hypothetical protein
VKEGTGKERLNEATQNELRKKNLCFSCKEPWVLGHICMGKGKVHYIEVHSDSDEEEEVASEQGIEQGDSIEEKPQEEAKEVAIATLLGKLRFHTFRVRGVLLGQGITTLIDGGATHNFIDVAWVARRWMATEDFEGFSVAMVDGYNVSCTKKISKLTVTLGNYTLTDDFYVVGLEDSNIVLGVQWLQTVGDITSNYKVMTMKFFTPGGKQVMLRGMSNNTSMVVSNERMEAIFRRGDIAYAVECFIIEHVDAQGR